MAAGLLDRREPRRASILPRARSFLPKLRLTPRDPDPLMARDDDTRTPAEAPPSRCRPQHRRDPRGGPGGAGERSRRQHGGDRSPGGRGARHHLRPLPDPRALLDAVMEHAIAQVVEAMRGAEPQRGEPVEALQRVLRATWRELARFHALLAINTARLSAEELHRRHLPMLDQLEPLIERGQKQGVFRSDLPSPGTSRWSGRSFTPPAPQSRAAASRNPKPKPRC